MRRSNILIYTLMYLHIYFILDMLWISVWWWWLRSTTGPYGRTFLEAAYGERIFHSIEAVCKMVAREKWLGCQHDASPMLDIPGLTPMWAPCILFFDFSWYKNLYKYVLVLKSISIIKEYWWTLTLSWPDKVQRMFSTTHEF